MNLEFFILQHPKVVEIIDDILKSDEFKTLLQNHIKETLIKIDFTDTLLDVVNQDDDIYDIVKNLIIKKITNKEN